MSLVVLLCIFSSIYMSFLRYGLYACLQYSKWGLTIALYRGIINLFSLYVIFLRIIPRTWWPLNAAILHCSDTFMSAFIVTRKSFSFKVLLRIVPPISQFMPVFPGHVTKMLPLYNFTIPCHCRRAWNRSHYARALAASSFWLVDCTLFGDHISLRLHWEFSLKFKLFN